MNAKQKQVKTPQCISFKGLTKNTTQQDLDIICNSRKLVEKRGWVGTGLDTSCWYDEQEKNLQTMLGRSSRFPKKEFSTS